MIIQAIEVYLANMGNRNIPFVRVLTGEGLHGVGEAYSIGPDRATVAAIEDLAEWLIGRDPLDIEGLWQLMVAGSRFPTGSVVTAAVSGIEHALWDIKGKALGVPVYELIGGKCREKVRVYQSVGGRTPEELAENAADLVATRGYTALKMFPFDRGDDPLWHDMGLSQAMKGAEARIAAVGDAVGEGVDIGLDAHAQIVQPSTALTLCYVLQPYFPLFLEEPLRPENRAALGRLRAKAPIPIATGECLVTKYEFGDLLAHAAADIIQPDVCLMGGLWEMKKVAAMAEAAYVHFALSTHNFLILEYRPDDDPARAAIVDAPMVLEDGYLLPPERPGLGIDLNVDVLKAMPYKAWHRPFLWRADGALGYQ
jgi:galactonate dehydratase